MRRATLQLTSKPRYFHIAAFLSPAGVANGAGIVASRRAVRMLGTMAISEEKPPSFTVRDRRSFVAPAGAEPPGEVASETPAGAEAPADAARGEPVPDRAASSRGLPPVDFSTFVLSLGSSALVHLGEVEHPQEGNSERDLPMAKHTIDVLSMLEEKTRGNRSEPEQRLIESLLYDLRLRYVAAARS